MYDFANLLFAGPCNARCYFCIGRQLDPALNPYNLNAFPPRNLDRFIGLIRKHKIRQVVFTGTNTDPQLYRHETRLLNHIREQLPPEAQFSLHTNGRLALRKIETFNQYDRATLSLPSFDPSIYQQMMGVSGPPDLVEILHQVTIPVKISSLVSAENATEIPEFLMRCLQLGIRRVVLRKPFGELLSWKALISPQSLPLLLRDEYRANPVFDFQGMEVTLWDFHQSSSRSINLFASGMISSSYLLINSSKQLKYISMI